MSYRVRYTRLAREDLRRLYSYLPEQDLGAASQARDAITKGIAVLQDFPFTCRKPNSDSPFIRELVIPFGAAGCVVLFEIDSSESVTILEIRYQREDDCH